MREYVDKTDVIEMLESLPRDIVIDHIYDIKGIWLDEEYVHERKLEQLPSAQRKLDEWCKDCKEYDRDKHRCPRFNRVIRTVLDEVKPQKIRGRWIHQDNIDWVDTWVCSECGEQTTVTVMGKPRFEYCPMCGAEMEEN